MDRVVKKLKKIKKSKSVIKYYKYYNTGNDVSKQYISDKGVLTFSPCAPSRQRDVRPYRRARARRPPPVNPNLPILGDGFTEKLTSPIDHPKNTSFPTLESRPPPAPVDILLLLYTHFTRYVRYNILLYTVDPAYFPPSPHYSSGPSGVL